ncbi:NGFI-A-binding protein 2-like isoform X2 [Acanthaster planci]|uniref:NGFI-A-binding protein 2-like isoform X2 n=1 Tax=Acanthaster planci TaxID=133434 RepID=A0A8B7ZIX0_ACAPL|nr:NGFI-A-binding protein 2-like isoform X2 [Acanthaster planci]
MATHPTCTNPPPINPSNPSEYQLYQVLERANLLGYFSNFIQQGGDDVTQLCEASNEEFMEILALVGMSSKPLHIRRLQRALQEWAKENNVPCLQTQPSTAPQQPPLNSMPYASGLAGMQPQGPTARSVVTQWGPAHPSPSNQWNTGQPLASEHSSPSDSPRQTPPYAAQPGMSSQPSSQAPQQALGGNGKVGASGMDECMDPQMLRRVAQRIMASHTPSPITQTSQNRKLLSSVQHIIEMPPDHHQRLEEIQKWAPIYGRFDSKRKDDKPLTAHEISVNEAAIQLCCIDPYLLVQRDKLFPLARQVVRESGYQFKHGHSRSLKVSHSKNEEGGGSKAKRVKVESGTGAYRDTEVTTPNPRTVQAEILKLRREERMNEILMHLNSIAQKQSDIKASIAAARSEDNIQQVYDLKVQLEKLTTQQLLLMTEQTDLIKRQRRSDRYYVAKARAEEENGDLATPDDQLTDPGKLK